MSHHFFCLISSPHPDLRGLSTVKSMEWIWSGTHMPLTQWSTVPTKSMVCRSTITHESFLSDNFKRINFTLCLRWWWLYFATMQYLKIMYCSNYFDSLPLLMTWYVCSMNIFLPKCLSCYEKPLFHSGVKTEEIIICCQLS